MDIQKFEALEDTLSNARCPKDVFGNLPKMGRAAIILNRITGKQNYLDEVSKGKKDANLDYRTNLMNSRLGTLSQWAIEAVKNGTYDKRLSYRIRLQFVVALHKRKFWFLIETDTVKVYLSRLIAIGFEGYLRGDPFKIRRGGKTVTKGRVVYYGTHAACEYFQINEVRHFELLPSDYQVGDVFEIETWNYSTPENFIEILIGRDSLTKSFGKAFKKNANHLNKDQVLETIATGFQDSRKQFLSKKREFFVKS